MLVLPSSLELILGRTSWPRSAQTLPYRCRPRHNLRVQDSSPARCTAVYCTETRSSTPILCISDSKALSRDLDLDAGAGEARPADLVPNAADVSLRNNVCLHPAARLPREGEREGEGKVS